MKQVTEIVEEHLKLPRAVAEAYNRHAGNIAATAKELGIPRQQVRDIVNKLGGKKPVAGGTVGGVKHKVAKLPPKGKVKRYIVTSAQNNTHVHSGVWDNILACADHWDAEILVGTFSYNQNNYGELAVKAGKKNDYQRKLWFDDRITEFIADERIELGAGLVWCGEMNILPTAEDPLSGLETYSHRKSAIFPHVKMSLRAIPTMKGEGTKLNYTTGTVTMCNYIQKKSGLKAEHHHVYGALVVEVDHTGYWAVRQLEADSQTGLMQDLDLVASGGDITTGNRIEAITWGDIHATCLDPAVHKLSMEMLDVLKPKHQFMHDIIEGVSINHHIAKNPHEKFKAYLRGMHVVAEELTATAKVLNTYHREGTKMVVVDSNHDNWLERWLREHDYRNDQPNAILFLQAQLNKYISLEQKTDFHLIEWAMQRFGCPDKAEFLRVDESYTICDKRIECGMHGHLGPNGTRGTAKGLSPVGRRSNTAHSHVTGIYNGLWVAGTSCNLDMGYNHGPSSWTHSHVLTYPNGRRSIVTMYNDKWRA